MHQGLLGAALAQLLLVRELCPADNAKVLPSQATAGRAAIGHRHLARAVADAAFCRAALQEFLHLSFRGLTQGYGPYLSAAIAVGTGLVSHHQKAPSLASLAQIHRGK